MIQPSPAIVTQLAARRLPRWVLVLLGAFYIVPGFLGRDPWRSDELASFGVMLQLSQHPEQWAHPQLLGEAAATAGWLPYWLGALAIGLMPGLPADVAAKFPFALLLLATLASTWYAAFHLARLPEAQPVLFAFGGEARPVDYARATGDAALLALVACLGLALLAHETSVDAVRLACIAFGLHAAARSFSPSVHSHGKTVALWWLSAWGLALSGVPWLALTLGMLVGVSHGVVQRLGRQSARLPVGWSLLGLLGSGFAAGTVVLLAPDMRDLSLSGLSHWQAAASWESLGRLLLWFTWPTGLLAWWALWRWRRQWSCAHWLVPVTWSVALLAMTWLERGHDRALLMALPALACLAAFALSTVRRSVMAWLDWFALLFFTGSALLIWLMWTAMTTGIPEKPAQNIARLFPSFEPTFHPVLFAVALVATVGWVGVMAWRVGRHRPALWKSLVLSASGTTLCWVLLMTLWLPLLNHGMGLAPISQRIAALTPPGDCVAIHGLNQTQIAGLTYHGGLRLARTGTPEADHCSRLVVDTADYASLQRSENLTEWSLVNRIPRLRDNRETWMLFERRAAVQP